jgi:hypothetical protein
MTIDKDKAVEAQRDACNLYNSVYCVNHGEPVYAVPTCITADQLRELIEQAEKLALDFAKLKALKKRVEAERDRYKEDIEFLHKVAQDMRSENRLHGHMTDASSRYLRACMERPDWTHYFENAIDPQRGVK